MCDFFLLQSQLGISEVELKDVICEKERKLEEIHNSLREIQVSLQSVTRWITFQIQSWDGGQAIGHCISVLKKTD